MTRSREGRAPGRRRWEDLTDRQRTGVLTAGSVQLALAATAWADLWFRPAAQVRGRKPVWAAVIGIGWVGPLLYLSRGVRRRTTSVP